MTLRKAPPAPLPGALLDFLNALPSSSDLLEWTGQMRDALRTLVPDVDDIGIAINGHFIDESTPLAGSGIWLIETSTPILEKRVFVDGTSHARRISDWMRNSGIALERFHPPLILEYNEAPVQLGAMVLLRERDKPPISAGSLEILGALESFFAHLFVEYLVRFRAAHPGAPALYNAMSTLAEECGLTQQERRVLNLRLFGLSYKDIADRLSISITTVSQHLAAAHRKAGVHSQTELFAKYFAPHLGLMSP
jgi:DNA-binding CsgD family transcriptional regulator